MHLSYYFIRQIAFRLHEVLQGKSLSEAYTQSKDEIIFRFNDFSKQPDDRGITFFINAYLTSVFCCLTFPKQHQRKRKNSMNLFRDIVGLKILEIKPFENERAFTIRFKDAFQLIFKLFGNRSNILLFHDETCIEMFHDKMSGDSQLNPSAFDIPNNADYTSFVQNPDLKTTFPMLGKLPEIYLNTLGYKNANAREKWDLIHKTIALLMHPESYFLTRIDDKWHLSLLSIGQVQTEIDNPFECVSLFFKLFIRQDKFNHEKQKILTQLMRKKTKAKNYISKTKAKLFELKKGSSYRQMADILMSNLHEIKPNAKSVILHNFYTGKNVEIKLKPDLTTQKNAEIYYRKSKNISIEIEILSETIKRKTTSLNKTESTIISIHDIYDLKKLSAFTVQTGLKRDTMRKIESVPYIEREFMGWRILIGKNAKRNDLLIQKFTWKEDLWLHVKDGPGSHVIVKYKSGKKFNDAIIQKAAGLAAYYSKRKNESLCPVIYTPRKFVRKRKGDPPGVVAVDKEKVVLVEPKN